jgi:streptomycin 6-kinase
VTTAVATDRRVPDDRALPHLAALFDLEGMSHSLTAHWSEGEQGAPRIIGCEIERVKYRPGRNCVVGYRLQVKWPRRPGRVGWRRTSERLAATRICAAMYPRVEAALRYERARAAADAAGIVPEVALLSGPGVLLWRFPHDRKLSTLPLLADSDWLRNCALPDVVRRRWGEKWRIESARNELVSYFPHHSATLRSRLSLSYAAAAPQAWHVYGKVRHDDAGAHVFDAMTRLMESDANRAGHVGYARPLAIHAAERVLWQEGIDAPTLDQGLREGHVDAATWATVARALASLHRTPLGLTPSVTRESLQIDIERATITLAAAVPSLAAQAHVLQESLLRGLEHIECAPDATLHGDMHGKNVLLGADRAYLIDLDCMGAGPRLAELGGLLAELMLRDCMAGRAVDWHLAGAVALAYQRAHEARIDPDDLAWHVAAALLRQPAYRSVTSLRPGRLEILPQLLDASHAALRGAIREVMQ